MISTLPLLVFVNGTVFSVTYELRPKK